MTATTPEPGVSFRWCLDGWYVSRDDAVGMADFFRSWIAVEAHVVEHESHKSYGVVYLSAEPYVPWHLAPYD
ncbi:MAG: hypothetical protein ACYC0H_23505 [Solirubrobacteraceae bacterium]